VDGPEGVGALRAIVAQRVDPLEVRTTALVALAKRQRAAASDVLLACLNDWDDLMPGYALLGLAAYGDDRAWGEIVDWLRATLHSQGANPEHDFDDRTVMVQSQILVAVAYLARHSAGDWDRQHPVVRLLRSRWNRLRGSEQRWITVTWPACDPSQPEALAELDAS
jgi:hypothetical protein